MTIKHLFLVFLIFILVSCNPCKNDDCPSNAKLTYLLVDVSGNNLYEIQNNNYNPDSLKIGYYQNGKKISTSNGLPSAKKTSFQLISNIDSVIVSYNKKNYDVFKFKNIISKKDKCCGEIIDDFDAEINGKEFCKKCTGNTWNIVKE